MNKPLTIGIILTLFSTPAFAQSSSSGGLESLLPLILVLVAYYFYWKAQKKKREALEIRLAQIEDRLNKIERS